MAARTTIPLVVAAALSSFIYASVLLAVSKSEPAPAEAKEPPQGCALLYVGAPWGPWYDYGLDNYRSDVAGALRKLSTPSVKLHTRYLEDTGVLHVWGEGGGPEAYRAGIVNAIVEMFVAAERRKIDQEIRKAPARYRAALADCLQEMRSEPNNPALLRRRAHYEKRLAEAQTLAKHPPPFWIKVLEHASDPQG